MNEFTNQLEQDAKRKTYILKGLQAAIVIIILLSYALATVRHFRREKYYNNLMEIGDHVPLSCSGTSTVDYRSYLSEYEGRFSR